MADDESEFTLEGEDGGARKSFWGHLQDLRGALVRSAIAVGIAFFICVFAGPRLVTCSTDGYLLPLMYSAVGNQD